jgi:hypothetical protein
VRVSKPFLIQLRGLNASSLLISPRHCGALWALGTQPKKTQHLATKKTTRIIVLNCLDWKMSALLWVGATTLLYAFHPLLPGAKRNADGAFNALRGIQYLRLGGFIFRPLRAHTAFRRALSAVALLRHLRFGIDMEIYTEYMEPFGCVVGRDSAFFLRASERDGIQIFLALGFVSCNLYTISRLTVYFVYFVAVRREAQSELATICNIGAIPMLIGLLVGLPWLAWAWALSSTRDGIFVLRFFTHGVLPVLTPLILYFFILVPNEWARETLIPATKRSLQHTHRTFARTIVALLPKFLLLITHALSGAVSAYCCWKTSHPVLSMLHLPGDHSSDGKSLCVNEVGVYLLVTGWCAGLYRGYCFFKHEEGTVVFHALTTGKVCRVCS